MDSVMINQLPELVIPRNRTFASVNKATTVQSMEKRNPYISKWYVLFDNKNDQWISFKPKAGQTVYPCFACRDMFGGKNSFLDHVNRRGLLLKYRCGLCRKNLIFYNTCSFLLHARDHFSEYGGKVDLDYVEISSIPMEIAGFLPISNIPRLYDKDDVADNENIIRSVKFFKPFPNCIGKRMVHFQPFDLLFFPSANENNNPDFKEAMVIKQINEYIPKCIFVPIKTTNDLPAPSNSESESDSESDIVCLDEDSTSTSNSNAAFTQKIQVKSMNSLLIRHQSDSENDSFLEEYTTKTKTKSLCCSECGVKNITSLACHFQVENKPHVDHFKCKKCGLISTSGCSLKAHLRIHDKKSPFVCPECGDIFNSWNELNAHMEFKCFHTAKTVRFKCPAKKCGKIFAQTITFSSHFPFAHIQVRFACTVCNKYFATEVEYQQHVKNDGHGDTTKPLRIHECTVCQTPADDIKNHVLNHVQNKDNRMYVFICKYCRSYYRSKQTYGVHLLKCTKLLLNNQVKKEVQRIDSHNDFKSQRLNEVEVEGDGSPSNSATADSNKKKRKRLLHGSLKNKRTSGDRLPDDILPSEPIIFDGEYKCRLCKFANVSRELFHEHIQEHRDVSTSYQCMECGECFVVKPSLLKHLQVFHLVEDLELYMNQNECFNKEAVRMLEENMRMVPGEVNEPVADNQCRVCRQFFSDTQELSKHFRVHGMAFLMKKIK